MAIQELVGRVLELRQVAANARAEAERDRRRRRQENDLYVAGGVNWNGYGLESLIKMVAERASPGQLDALAGEWRRHGSSVVTASTDLQRSLDRLMNYWSGASADDAARTVTTNSRWVSELGEVAQQMADPIQDASGALRSAQDTMPGKPSDAWYAGAGGGALAGFAVAGPIGAAFGAAIGGIASAFGFGSSKRKLKRKAVQTMQRFEGAVLGIDQTTPQFGLPSDGVDPGADRLRNPGTGVGSPTPNTPAPGSPGATPLTPGPGGGNISTVPSLAGGGDPVARWRGITSGPTPGFGGLGPGGGFGTGGLPGGLPGLIPPGRGPGVGGSRGGIRPGVGVPPGAGGGRGAGSGSGRRVGGRGLPLGAGGLGARGGMGQDGEHRGRGGRAGSGVGGRGGYGAGGLGAGGRAGLGDDDAERRRGRFGRGGALDPRGTGYGGVGGAGSRKEEDEEHHRRFPVEEDPFSASDLKAAPPVIGL